MQKDLLYNFDVNAGSESLTHHTDLNGSKIISQITLVHKSHSMPKLVPISEKFQELPKTFATFSR